MAGKKPLYLSEVGRLTQFDLGDTYIGLENVNNTADIDKPISRAVEDALAGKISSDSPSFSGTASFGSRLGQHLNLFGNTYGFGIQSNTLYARTGSEFVVFKNGTHADATAEPGSGGSLLLRLSSSTFQYLNNTVYHSGNAASMPVSTAQQAALDKKIEAAWSRNSANLILDQNIENAESSGYSFYTSIETAANSTKFDTANGSPTSKFLWRAATSGAADVSFRTDGIPVHPGEEYIFETTVAVALDTTASSLNLNVRRFDRAGSNAIVAVAADSSFMPVSILQGDFDGSWVRLRGRFTVPTGCIQISPLVRLNGNSSTPAGGFATTQWNLRRVTDDSLFSSSLSAFQRGGENMISAGNLVATTNEVKWTNRILFMGAGNGPHTSTAGFYSLDMPASGTVIPVYGDRTINQTTVTDGGVPLGSYHVLYAVPTVGGNATARSYAIVGYNSPFVVPKTWIRIVGQNADLGVHFHWWNGTVIGQNESFDLSQKALQSADLASQKIFPDGGRSVNARPLSSYLRLTPLDFGAVPDAVVNGNVVNGTDNTAAFQAYFDKCRDLDISWYIPPGKWRIVGNVECWTGGTCDGTLYFPNSDNGRGSRDKFLISTRDEDIEAVTLDTMKTWTVPEIAGQPSPARRYSRRLPKLINRRNRFFSFSARSASATADWKPNTTYAVGARVKTRADPKNPVSYTRDPSKVVKDKIALTSIFNIYESVRSGTTGSTEIHNPSGSTFTDGSVQWKYISNSYDTRCYNIRRGPPDQNDAIESGEGFLITTDQGDLGHDIYHDWSPSKWVNGGGNFKTLRERITISGLSIVFYLDTTFDSGTDLKSANAGVVTARCNTTVSNGTIHNISGRNVAQGHVASGAYSVRYENCNVHGLMVASTQYGFNSGGCADVIYHGCSESNCRRGIDAHNSKNIVMVACSLPSGWGAHYAWSMGSIGCAIGSSNSASNHAVHVAGGDFYIIGGQCTGTRWGTALFRARDDIYEVGMRILIDGVVINLPELNNVDGIYSLCDLTGPNELYDPGRTTDLPENITIVNNTILVQGAQQKVSMLGYATSAWSKANDSTGYILFQQDISSNARVTIKGNSVRYVIGGDLDASNSPRTTVSIHSPDCMVGRGVEFDISDLPGFTLTTHGKYTFPDASGRFGTARINGKISNCQGPVWFRYSPGAYKTVWVDSEEFSSAKNSASAGYPSVGDEKFVWLGRNTALGNRTSSGDAAVNGYVTFRTPDGTLVKLATVA